MTHEPGSLTDSFYSVVYPDVSYLGRVSQYWNGMETSNGAVCMECNVTQRCARITASCVVTG